MPTCCSNVRWGGILLGTTLALTFLFAASAQEQQLGTKKELEDAYSQVSQQRSKYFSGEDKPTGPNDKKAQAVAKAIAEYSIYRITHRNSYLPFAVQDDFDKKIVSVLLEKRAGGVEKENREFIKILVVALVHSMKEVLARDAAKDPTTVINAALMLPTMARLKDNTIGDYLAELIDKKETHDIVRLPAFKAIRDNLPIIVMYEDMETDPKNNMAAILARKPRDIKYVNALAKYIERPVDVKGMTPGQIDAVRFVRREAIITLAQAGAPAVSAIVQAKKVGVVEGAVAPTLLKVLSKDGLHPSAGLQEKVEAALGLCVMKHTKMPEYNSDLAGYMISQTILELATEYNKDLPNFVAAGAKKQVPMVPFKTDARRLSAGLNVFAKNGNPKSAELKEHARLLLAAMGNYVPIDNSNLKDLRRQQELRPKSAYPFKNIKTPEIQLD